MWQIFDAAIDLIQAGFFIAEAYYIDLMWWIWVS